MKKFQPLNATEHLQALYAAGEDWAGEALAIMDAASDVSAALGFDRDTYDFQAFALTEAKNLKAECARLEAQIAEMEQACDS